MNPKTKSNSTISTGDYNQKKRQIPITSILQGFFFVLSIVSSVISIYKFFTGQETISLLFFIITLFVILLFIMLRVSKITSDHKKKVQVIADEFHTYSHSLRDYKYKLDNLVKDKQYNNEALSSLVDNFSDKVANQISQLFSVLYTRDCNTSIKFIKNEFWDNSKINIKKENVELCRVIRCKKSDRRRKDDDLSMVHKIKDDTGCYEIFINEKPHYSLLNISEYEKSNQYKDSNSHRVRYYDNLLIVPIRIKKHILDSTKPECNENNLFGFITLDFLKSGGISENDVQVGLDYLKAFADSSYLIFDEIRAKFR